MRQSEVCLSYSEEVGLNGYDTLGVYLGESLEAEEGSDLTDCLS